MKPLLINLKSTKAVILISLLASQCAALSASYVLQGQSRGDTNTWIGGNVQNWRELDYIPCRVYFTGGPATNLTVSITFPHINGTTPGFENIYNFSLSSNVVFASTPVLSSPANADWTYTFTCTVTDGNPGTLNFLARLAAGAHLNAGSSLMLRGNPTSMGNLQVHKPAPGPGAPDLKIVKSAPATTSPGNTITYTLSYTNKAVGTNTARGVQVSDILPAGLIVDTNTIGGGYYAGNTVFWDVPNLAPGASGTISFQAKVSAANTNGNVLANYAQILSSENDANMSDNSSTATTTVIITCVPPTIASNPASQTVCPGSQVSFSGAANGTAPSLQWLKNGNPISGATNASYSIASASSGDAGTYALAASNSCGIATSSAANLIVNIPTSATALANQIACPGNNVTFATFASGTGPFTYQWYKNGSPLTANTDTLVLSNVSASDIATYSVIVSGACGSVTNSASLSVNTPVNATPLVSSTNCPGTTATFNTVASGTGPFTYQWFKNSSPVGAAGNTLVLANVSAADNATYTVIVSGVCGSVTNSGSLSVNTSVSATPLISLTNCPGTAATFNTAASGTGPFTYQWFKNGSSLGANTNTLILANVAANSIGLYSVIVSGACGSITNSATLSVNTAVSATPLENLTNCPGTTATFSTIASGTGPFIYQWFKNGSPLNESTGALILTNVSAADVGSYTVNVNGACGSVTNVASLSVNTPVSATPLVSLTNCPGTTATFSTVASGTGPFTYQWFKNSSPLSAAGNTLALANVSSADVANYCVIVSGACGSVTNVASLSVNAPLSATPLVSLTNCPGATATFNTVASGTGPFSYQWFKNGSPLSAAGNTLVLANVSSADVANYCVIVSGACGSATNVASLSVNTPASATPLGSLTNCPGTTATFSTVASGTGPFSYQWFKNGSPLGANTDTLVLSNISSNDAGLYCVIINGACGSVTNSANLGVNQNVSISALASVTKNIGDSVTYSVSASGTGPLTFAWKKNNQVLSAQTGASLTLNNLTPTDGGTYKVEVSGACGDAAVASAVLTMNQPPTANITVPTNNSVFVAPATFTVLASASDPDGVVTNVEFFISTNNADYVKIGESSVAPYFLVLTNVPTNSYSFIARATDNMGATGNSDPLSISVIERPPLRLLGGITFNPQDGLFHLTNVVVNPTYSIFNAVRVRVEGITNPIIVMNASGYTNGIPYVQSSTPILPGTSWTNVIKFYVPIGALIPNPKLVPELITPAPNIVALTNGTAQKITRGLFLRDRTFMLEFVTTANRTYYIQYSSDMQRWTTVQPPITGNGTSIQWIDAGPPETETLPQLSNKRFYKIISIP
jgi:uncharacterized repeat protein (TIGR01451 family)